jgi:hypothetical protein
MNRRAVVAQTILYGIRRDWDRDGFQQLTDWLLGNAWHVKQDDLGLGEIFWRYGK